MISRLERLWRQVGTAISFAVFGLGGLAMTVFVFPLVNSIFRDRSRRAEIAQRMVHRAWRIFVKTMVALRVMDFEAVGADILRREAGTLVIANHPSLIDVVLIMSLMDRTQCVVKPGVWKNPFMRGVIRATNYIPNAGDSQKMVDDCVSALKAGNNLVIFPEGSRTVSGRAMRLQRGFAAIAIRACAPIRLVFVTCNPPTLRKGEKWYRSPPRRPVFLVRVCERVDTESFARSEIASRAARTLTDYIARRFEELNCHGRS
ncbi:MAG TPA: lysophospholipid acyltransferase family protein [Rhizomicrobium sp.]|jgi:1-acyl-sn-glycerol-3-phosphate acyltransferase|nr:lysophospholipid acyltransferase family protein [Rhizomicrobium sp.]